MCLVHNFGFQIQFLSLYYYFFFLFSFFLFSPTTHVHHLFIFIFYFFFPFFSPTTHVTPLPFFLFFPHQTYPPFPISVFFSSLSLIGAGAQPKEDDHDTVPTTVMKTTSTSMMETVNGSHQFNTTISPLQSHQTHKTHIPSTHLQSH